MIAKGWVAAARTMVAAAALMALPAMAQRDASVGLRPQHIYPDVSAARAEIDHAMAEARRTHKRIILDFGADWCGDCQVLNLYFHQSPNAQILAKHYILVDVNIGKMDANLDIAHRYGVPVHGVPALAVIDGHGRIIMSQDKQFSSMRHMEPQAVTDFLNKWKQ